jgi:hypothetical protein
MVPPGQSQANFLRLGGHRVCIARGAPTRRPASTAYGREHDDSGRSSLRVCGKSEHTSTCYPCSLAVSYPRSRPGRRREKRQCPGTVDKRGCRKPCFRPSAARPLWVANTSVALRERVASFAAADHALRKYEK